MARINIEDSIYRDERFHRLSAFEGKYKALGLCVAAWDLAHNWYLKHPDGLIPFSEWATQPELALLEKYGLAERLENGIYVKGSKTQCEYLSKRSLAGKKGGLKSQEISASKRKQIEQNQPSSSSSSSISTSSSSSKKNKSITEGVKAPARSLGSEIWDSYRGAYVNRYGVEPVRNQTTNTQCANLGKRLGESAIEVVRFYLTHNDGYYLRNQHPIGLCLSQAESLHTQWQRGVAVTGTQVRNAEKTINNAETLEALRKQFGG
jgi:hypothetical protein